MSGHTCRIVKVERVSGFLAERTRITAEAPYGVRVEFDVPDHLAGAYQVDRTITVTLCLDRKAVAK